MKIRNRNRRQFVASVEQVESRCLLNAAPHYTVQDVGTSSIPILPNGIIEPFTLVPGETSLGFSSNTSGQITGVSTIVRYSISHAFFYSNGVISDITPNAAQAVGYSINNSGQVAGYEMPLNGYSQAFVTGPNGTGLTLISGPNVTSSIAYNINSAGDVVGISSIPGFGSRGFLYKDGTFYDLNDLLTQPIQGQIPGDHIAQAYSINDSGQILAMGNGNERYILTPVPQPTTPTITWSNPADIVYGTPLSSTQLDATASVPGTFTYTPAAGTVLHAGAAQTLSVTFTPDDTTDYTTVTTTTSINVLQAPLTVKANNAYSQIGFPIPLLTGTITGLVNGDTDIATYTTTATQSSYLGNYPIVPHLADPNYNITIVNGTLTIGYYPFPWPPF